MTLVAWAALGISLLAVAGWYWLSFRRKPEDEAAALEIGEIGEADLHENVTTGPLLRSRRVGTLRASRNRRHGQQGKEDE